MTDEVPLITAWIAGGVLAILFFGGLWWTVPKAIASPRPGLWFGLSLLLRMMVVLGGLYLVGGGDWTRILACLLGFIMMKPLVLWATSRFAREAAHAPDA